MKRTVKDIEKIGNSTVQIVKRGLYYLSVPVVIVVGLRSIDIARWFQPSV